MDLNELLARCCEVEKEALIADYSKAADAVPYFIHTQESFPYFTHRIVNGQIGYDSEDMDRSDFDVIIRLVIGHVTDNYVGVNESDLYDYIPTVIHAFNSNEGLTSAAYPTDMVNLIEATENRLRSTRGFSIFLDGGLKDVKQVGTEFTLTCQFNDDL